MKTKVEDRIKNEIQKKGTLCFALIDSENTNPKQAPKLVEAAEKCGISGILVGGSTAIDQLELTSVTKAIKARTKKPVILFPGNVTGVTSYADAILFSSLLNSDNPYFIIQAQALGALSVRKHGLEAIPTGYLIVGDGGVTGFVGRARGIPADKPDVAAMYSLAAQYLGMRFLYLEAGSGVMSHITTQMVTKVRKYYDGVLLVGGGINTARDASSLAQAGADIIVLGTIIEKGNFMRSLSNIVAAVEKVKGKR